MDKSLCLKTLKKNKMKKTERKKKKIREFISPTGLKPRKTEKSKNVGKKINKT
jgi:hypothetical protein